ncbi:fatty acid desaturase [soil metagenome]
MLPELRYKADRRTLAFVFTYFAATVLAWIFLPEQWYWRLPIVITLCLLSFFCAVIVHNTIHHPIFRSRGWNKAFQVIMSFTYGHSVSAYVPGHNFSHHNHTQTDKDRIRTQKARFKWNLLNQLFFFFIMVPGIMKDEQVFSNMMRKERPNWYRQYLLEMAVVMGIKIGLLIVDWQSAVLLLFIPHFYAAWGIVGTNYWQHDGCDETHEYNHSRNFTAPFLNFFAFNNGFHGIHHEKPGLHWSLLPAAHEKEIAPYIHPNLNRSSLAAFLWETHIYPGKRVDYLGNPLVLPPKQADGNWMEDVDLEKKKLQLGVEG